MCPEWTEQDQRIALRSVVPSGLNQCPEFLRADSNHGYKMLGVGQLVAKEILGESSVLLQPFRFARYEKGELHPVSHSPFSWS